MLSDKQQVRLDQPLPDDGGECKCVGVRMCTVSVSSTGYKSEKHHGRNLYSYRCQPLWIVVSARGDPLDVLRPRSLGCRRYQARRRFWRKLALRRLKIVDNYVNLPVSSLVVVKPPSFAGLFLVTCQGSI